MDPNAPQNAPDALDAKEAPKEPLGPPELPKGTKFQPLSTVQPKLPGAIDAEEDDALNEHVQNPGDPDGLIAAEERRKWQAENPAPKPSPVPMAKKPRKKHRILTAFVILVLIAAAAYGAYWFGGQQADKDKNKSAAASKSAQQDAQNKQASEPAATVSTKHYDSTTYTLGLDHPQDWVVTDSAAKLTITSPTVSLATATGSNVNGHVVVTIQNQQSTIAGYPAGGAVAVLASEKLTYKQPTPVQRAQTYLSYLSYGRANGLDALYITGDNGYQKDQLVPSSDVVKGNPLISVTFQSCTSTDCSTGTPTMLTLSASDWVDEGAYKQVTDLLKSIQIN